MKLCDDEGDQDENQFEWCKAEREENNDKNSNLEDLALSLEGDIDDLKNDIGHEETGTKAQMARLEESLEQNHKAYLQNEKDRDEDYHHWIEDEKNLKQAIKIITKAKAVMTTYYEKITPQAAFLQSHKVGQKHMDAPETWTGAYQGQSSSGNQ